MENNPFCQNVVVRFNESAPCYCVSTDRDMESYLDVCLANSFIPIYGIEAFESMHTHEFYVIACIYEGEGTHVIDFKEYEIQKGTVFFLSPGQMHTVKNLMNVEGYILSFSQNMMDLLYNRVRGSLLQDLFHRFGNASICTIDDEARQYLDVIFKQMMEEKRKGFVCTRGLPCFIAYHVTAQFATLWSLGGASVYGELIERISCL